MQKFLMAECNFCHPKHWIQASAISDHININIQEWKKNSYYVLNVFRFIGIGDRDAFAMRLQLPLWHLPANKYNVFNRENGTHFSITHLLNIQLLQTGTRQKEAG